MCNRLQIKILQIPLFNFSAPNFVQCSGNISLVLFQLLLFAKHSTAQKDDGKVICTEYDEYVLTHALTPAGPVPTAYDANGVYPYMSYVETSNRPVPKKYHFIVLENEHMKVTICPGLGGK